MGGLSDRASRILQGGIPLPDVFSGMLSHLLENGRSAPAADLAKVVRVSLQDLHEPRVRTRWGSWENLAAELLEEMESRELVTRDGDDWHLTGRIYDGARVRPTTGIRITVYSGAARARREAMAFARARAISHRVFLEEQGLYSGKIRKAFDAYLDSLDWDLKPRSMQVRKGDISRFTREHLQSLDGQWVAAKDVEMAFREMHPEYLPRNKTSSSFWNPLNQLYMQGLADRREEKVPGTAGRKHSEFRWKQEQ